MPPKYLVHFSDLHLEGTESWAAFRLAETICQQLKPRVLVVSGDFLDHPHEARMQRVKARLDQLCTDSGGCRLVVVPGNHDCKIFGLYAVKNPAARFERVFGADWKKPVTLKIGKHDVVIFCFDSNTSNPQINFARGRVGTAEYGRFNQEYAQQSGSPAFERAFKIAVLHHHPLPIAASEGANYFGKDAFLGLEDAGSFMEEMIAKRIDPVLHGHKHFPLFARVHVTDRDSEERGTVIVAAGSTSKPSQSANNSFNLVEFHDDGRVDVIRYDRGNAGFERRQKRIGLLSYDACRGRAFEAFCAESDRVTQFLAHNYLIDRFGDCQRLNERRGLTVPRGNPTSNE
jgi:3',5'-cyclic AMP phosphodiesterase CpdA